MTPDIKEIEAAIKAWPSCRESTIEWFLKHNSTIRHSIIKSAINAEHDVNRINHELAEMFNLWDNVDCPSYIVCELTEYLASKGYLKLPQEGANNA